MTNISLSNLSTQAELSTLHQVLLCSTHILPQLYQLWETFQTELADEFS